ncbi:hypothetical protein D6833_10470, partial [Candidatus Parcubacteria bacterium]
LYMYFVCWLAWFPPVFTAVAERQTKHIKTHGLGHPNTKIFSSAHKNVLLGIFNAYPRKREAKRCFGPYFFHHRRLTVEVD